MFKIIAISCIFAASLNLQNVKGMNLFPYFGLVDIPSLLTNFSTGSYNQNLDHLKDDIDNLLKGYINRIHDATVVCTKVYDDAVDATQQLTSIFSSCLKKTNETYLIESEIQKLVDVGSVVKKNLTNDVQETITKCVQNPPNIVSCLTTISNNLAEINLNDLLDVALSDILRVFPFTLTPYVPNVIKCYNDLSHHFNSEYFNGLLADQRYCMQSIKHVFV